MRVHVNPTFLGENTGAQNSYNVERAGKMTSASLSQRGSYTASPTRAPLIPQLILNMAKNILRRTSGSHQSSRAKCVADFIVWSVVVWFLRMRDEKSAAGVEMRLKKKDIFLTTANKKHLTDPCHIMSSLVCLTCQTMTREKKELALGSRAEKDKLYPASLQPPLQLTQ